MNNNKVSTPLGIIHKPSLQALPGLVCGWKAIFGQ